MGTPQTRCREMHQSGAAGDHVGDALFAPLRHPVDAAGWRRARAARRSLLSMPMNHCSVARKMVGVVAAPAMRIGVLDLARCASSAPCSFRISMTIGIGFPDGLAEQFRGQMALGALRIEEAAGGIHRAIDLEAVLHADDVIFLAVSGRGVDRAGALLQRDVIAQDAERIALDERDGGRRCRSSLRAGEARRSPRHRSSRTFPRSLQADLPRRCRRRSSTSTATYSILRMKRDGEVGRDGPGRGGPDQAVDVLARPAQDRSPPDRTSAQSAPRSTGSCGSRIRLRLRPARCGRGCTS